MLHKVTALVIAACGALLACNAAALTVGAVRGAVLVGRPLDLSIPVTLDAPGDQPCATAEVLYGEQRLARDPVLRWEAGSGGQGVLRITSPLPVDEPVVTVNLRVGCVQATSRRFVLLSDLPPADSPTQASPAAPALSQAPIVVRPDAARRPAAGSPPAPGPGSPSAPGAGSPLAPGAASSSTPGAGSRLAPGAASPSAPGARSPSPATGRSPGTAGRPGAVGAAAGLRPERALPGTGVAASRARRPASGLARPRLRLEGLDLGPERDPVLRFTSELRSQVTTDAKRREDAAALWRVLQKGPEELLQESLRVRAIEGEIRTLRESTQRNAASVAQLRSQLEKARSERSFAATAVIAVSVVLLALLAFLGWRWYTAMRMNRVGRWFEEHGDSSLGVPLATPAPPPARTPAGAIAPGTWSGTAPGTGSGTVSATGYGAAPDVDLTLLDLPGATPVAPVPLAADSARPSRPAASTPLSVAPAAPEEFQVSRGGSMRMVGVEELLDVHDKADFFLSIGEYDQAVAVLDAHVHDQVETSALAWLDLLELYHSLGRRVEFERLRSEFRQRFTGEVPDFEHFAQPTATLENYGRALSRIVALWTSPRVLDVIEESIFRKPGLPGSEPFSLEAYRELVLLYHVAKEINQLQAAPAGGPVSPHDTSLQPLNAVEGPGGGGLQERERLMIPPASARLGVDIDVSELSPLDFDLDEHDPAPSDAARKRG